LIKRGWGYLDGEAARGSRGCSFSLFILARSLEEFLGGGGLEGYPPASGSLFGLCLGYLLILSCLAERDCSENLAKDK